MGAAAGEALGIDASQVLVCSTGIIGTSLPMDPILHATPKLAKKLSVEGGHDVINKVRTGGLSHKRIEARAEDSWERNAEVGRAVVEHEATTSKIGEDQLFYARSRGIGEEDAVSMIVNGFCKQVFKELPMEFAVEAQKLLQVSLEGAVG